MIKFHRARLLFPNIHISPPMSFSSLSLSFFLPFWIFKIYVHNKFMLAGRSPRRSLLHLWPQIYSKYISTSIGIYHVSTIQYLLEKKTMRAAKKEESVCRRLITWCFSVRLYCLNFCPRFCLKPRIVRHSSRRLPPSSLSVYFYFLVAMWVNR